MLFTYFVFAPFAVVLAALCTYVSSLFPRCSGGPLRVLVGFLCYLAAVLVVVDDWIFFRWARVLAARARSWWTSKPVTARVRPTVMMLEYADRADTTEDGGVHRSHRHRVITDMIQKSATHLRETSGIELVHDGSVVVEALDNVTRRPTFAPRYKYAYFDTLGRLYPLLLRRSPLRTQIVVVPDEFDAECIVPPGYIVVSDSTDARMLAELLVKSTQVCGYLAPFFSFCENRSFYQTGENSWRRQMLATSPMWVSD